MDTDGSDITVCCIDSTSPEESYTGLYDAIRTADYMAVDLEMSGIGSKTSLRATSVEDRYHNLCQTASTHSILSMGVACFRSPHAAMVRSSAPFLLECAVFDIVLFSQTPYMVNPYSLNFLCSNGFDFNHQYRHGLRYTPSFTNTDQSSINHTDHHSVQRVFLSILSACKPVVFHNGFIDLIFLYSHLYAAPPNNLGTFTADLCEMFSGGLHDTKLIPLSDTLVLPSYLEYLLYYSCHRNFTNASKHLNHIKLVYPSIPCYPTVTIKAVHSILIDDDLPAICESYAERGFCHIATCTKSHDVAYIVAKDLSQNDIDRGSETGEEKSKKTKKKRKRKRNQKRKSDLEAMFSNDLAEAKQKLSAEHGTSTSNGEQTNNCSSDRYEETMVLSDSVIEGAATSNQSSATIATTNVAYIKDHSTVHDVQSHKSSRDAFATGYYFLQSALQSCTDQELSMDRLISIHAQFKNKIAINGKPMPLLITKSYYSVTSENHRTMKQYQLLQC